MFIKGDKDNILMEIVSACLLISENI